MKCVITLSKTFLAPHPRQGEQTNFAELILNGSKIHTIRDNYPWWRQRIDQLKNKGGTLSVRQWSALPYQSPQEFITEIPADTVGVELVQLARRDSSFTANVLYGQTNKVVELDELATNDGLPTQNFIDWFMPLFNTPLYEAGAKHDFALIQFTDFRYVPQRPYPTQLHL
jgi:hypothetical protein